MIPALALVAALAAPEDDPAVAAAEDAFRAQDYDAARDGFTDAYAKYGTKRLLWALAQSERLSGQCRDAIGHYEELIERDPGQDVAQQAADNIKLCEDKLADEPEPPPQPEPQPQPSPPDPGPPRPEAKPPADAPPPTDAPRIWYRDPWGAVLVAGGVASLALGGGLYGTARADEKRANNASDVDDYATTIERAATFSRAGIALFAVGGALTVAGIIRYAVVASKGRRHRKTAMTPFAVEF